MNKTQPSHQFTAEAVHAFEDGAAPAAAASELNPVARQIASHYRRNTMSPVMISGLLRLSEFVLIALGGLAVFLLYTGAPTGLTYAYPLVILAGAALSVFLLEFANLYQLAVLRRPFVYLPRMALVMTAAFALLAMAGFFLKISAEFSRVWFAGWLVAGLALMLLTRLVLSALIRRWARDGTMERRALIVGGGKPAETLIRTIEQDPDNDIRICGIFDDRDDARSPAVVAGYPKLGSVAELVEFARMARVDMLIVSLPLSAQSRVLSLLKRLWVLPVDIRLSAHSSQLRFRPRAYSYVGSVPMLDIFDKPINDWDSVAKRLFDIAFSLAGLIVFSPVMIATAIAIKLDSKGPVFFKQKRHGFNNEVIEVWKFRSMYADQSDPQARKVVTKGDPRVTRVGRFIRKTSIDELPQFFNSLGGSLSLVGPRPHALKGFSQDRLFEEVVDGYFARHRVKPGVTGWAQINGLRGEIDHDDKIRRRTEYDLDYIENWSLGFDLKILLLTPIRLLNTENAY
ncbi:undecaprenyl-phosphate glucose phosphotransferase [Aliihoeflea aestuarii]|jgi:Undecaprenyl-phosphate glucose phosphotransferase|uniref:undecaprenyl-phosphate glucose phosphotransferase n=1 Tax=Aliihoeflea aestuarii TaxID=453840 RepID=UPI0020935625|nr:undecaprenyl-phosphate glucose phosphotransferase [Aliihoeflea aestuarii]MCO6391936.1 undecaprenyl-phosphate glucose phosphotransferase [Aliihoeflea aestuarii]